MASFLILHGYLGSGPGHWQSWLAERLRDAGLSVLYPDLPAPADPELGPWREELARALGAAGEAPVVICHSLACILWLHHAADPVVPGRAARVLLVAPPSAAGAPEPILPFFPPPADPAGVAAAARATRLVCAPDDPYCPEGAAALYGAPLSLDTDVLAPGAGHVNLESGFGPWPAAEAWALGEDGGFGREEGR